MLKLLPIGKGSNLDVDPTSVKDGYAVAYYNCYPDRAGAVRTLPGLTLANDFGANTDVYSWDSTLHGVSFVSSNRRMWKRSSQAGAWTELTGVTVNDGMPTFTEDDDYIYFAVNSRIHKVAPTATTAELLGEAQNISPRKQVGVVGAVFASQS